MMKRILMVLVLISFWVYGFSQAVPNGTSLRDGDNHLWVNFPIGIVSGTDTTLWWRTGGLDVVSWSSTVRCTGTASGDGYIDYVVSPDGLSGSFMDYNGLSQDTVSIADNGLSIGIEDWMLAWGVVGIKFTKGTLSGTYYDIMIRLNARK